MTNKLPFVLANRALRWRLRRLVKLHSALNADNIFHRDDLTTSRVRDLVRNGVRNKNPKDKHERHNSLLVTNGSGATDMLFNSRRIAGINDFACAGDRDLQRLTDGDFGVRCAG